MDIFSIILIVVGLIIFETISSIDNAVINAEVLSTMSQRARRWFLIYGLFIAVFAVRGMLPWLIVWATNPALGPVNAFTATFSDNPDIAKAIEESSPFLLVGGGVFLIFLFFHWLFIETKNYGLRGERFFHKHGVWFFAVVSIILTVIVYFALKEHPFMALGAVVGSTAFFITHGFKQNAEQQEKVLMGGNMSDWSKILYLEVIDATFSIDGVVGAFAFTLSVPLILIGNGVGAFVVRELTLKNIENVKRYIFLKNGAMYSIFFLGIIMVLDSFGVHIPEWVSPVITIGVIGYFFYKSRKFL
ncbi:MAG: Integral membrane protein TerC family protein [Candidatus Methanoperedens nitroreducens]|uniref:Integral membrane protein TerC family protein n=1 Tax=Candidatus Methanoperedens nitratireducens TaxID=1392998 RepID=A0A0P7ZF73_9EURY|nr:DUF475 domain-containing protein [Candidatus Methanoperedens sp. BLZ2]KAB2945614.1 MAG: DUF475 domain-containing protein [Candidatus Methanoperedens sp.]KPQ42164.1 MAG: Integral membrane protein TerC family protein [Candidatus Methanoperedens sp. BLZ1]MBZ0176094.1 DUF475 domain-containing protein [Candidatus Methanoperedens nitroreducens]MCX9079383.1 DUF475 domain-containing protein [Candidatus Methanoperedens sp.]